MHTLCCIYSTILLKNYDCRFSVLISDVEQQKRRPVKSAISIDCNQSSPLIIRKLLTDAICYIVDCQIINDYLARS